MFWIRNLEASQTGVAVKTVEAELGAEVAVAGFLDYADGAVSCSRITVEADAAGMYKYLLRVRAPTVPTGTPSSGTPRGYVFREGPIGELLALFSLFLETRFYLLSISDRASGQDSFPIKREFRPLRGAFGPDLDGVIFSGTDRNFATGLGSSLDEIRSIPAETHQAVAFAANHYARALRQIGVDEEMVFVRLVSAVESVDGQQNIPEVRVDGRSLEQRLGLCQLTDDERKEFKKLIRTRRATQRFVAFLEEFSRDFFDREAREPERTQVTPERLGAIARAIYNARSDYLHNGDPMYLSLRIRDRPGRHMDPFKGMTWQGRRFKTSQKLPYSDFFHRLVRHCLLSYIRGLRPIG